MVLTIQRRLPSENTTNNQLDGGIPLTPPTQNPIIVRSKKRRIANKSEASALENETRGYLGARSRTTAYRTASYRPTLEKFSSVSFPNYVRRVLLGVPIDGVQPEDPYFSSCSSDDEHEGDNGKQPEGISTNITAAAQGLCAQVMQHNVAAMDDNMGVTEDNNPCTHENITVNSTSEGDNGMQHEGIAEEESSDLRNNGMVVDDNMGVTEDNNPFRDENTTVHNTINTSPDQVIDLQFCKVVSQSPTSNSEVTQKEPDTSDNRAVPSSQNALSAGVSETRHPLSTLQNGVLREMAKEEGKKTKMTTRSQTRSSSRCVTTKNDDSGTNIYDKVFPSPTSSQPRRKRRIRPPPPMKPDELKLSDGIAKITPPVGWWDKAGIGKDTTGRGSTWQAGGSMGDMIIPGPIKQCASGIGGVYDFTMMELPPMKVAQFRKKADDYRKRQIGSEFDMNVGNKAMDELARKFWRRLGPTMEASIYGADMEGSLFDGADACGWNIDRLESCIQLLRAEMEDDTNNGDHFRLPGVTSAYLYFGMWASVFAAHTEDMNLPSINYLHAGAPKYWYAISPDDSDRFESLMESQFSSAASSCPQFLRHKSHLLSPSIITKAGISYTTQVQRAGDIIITFPGSYHFGFNTGFNIAESTNFAFPEWIPMGEKAKVCMCHPHSVRIDMKRFKEIHDKYEIETTYKDGPSMTYDEWAKVEGKRRRQTLTDRMTAQNNESEQQIAPKKIVKKGSRSRGKVVEVIKMLRHKKTMDLVLPPKKYMKKGADNVDWRLAVKAKKSAFCARAKVLCNVRSNDLVDVYFSGMISDVVEDHARVHFAGSSKNEDIWIQTNSTKLFLDGGSLESTQDKSKTKRMVTKKIKKK